MSLSGTNPDVTKQSANRHGTKTFFSDVWNFSITYPSDWQVIYENEPAGSWTIPIAVAGADYGRGRPSFMVNARRGEILQGTDNVPVYAAGPDGKPIKVPSTPQEYINMKRDTLRFDFQDFQFISAEEIRLANKPAAKLVYSYARRKGRITEESITLFGVGITFQFICEVPSALYDELRPGFQTILDSFRIGRSLPEQAVAQRADETPLATYNGGVGLYTIGDFEKALQAFNQCLRADAYKLQAAYARALCQQELGQEIALPSDVDADMAGPVYLATNLACHLIGKGYRAAVTKRARTSEVRADIDGARYLISVTSGFGFGGFFTMAWRQEGEQNIPIADPSANPNPTTADRAVRSLLENPSALPPAPLPEQGLPTALGEIPVDHLPAPLEGIVPQQMPVSRPAQTAPVAPVETPTVTSAPESLTPTPAPATPAGSRSAPERVASAKHTVTSSKKRNVTVLVLAIGLLALCVLLPLCLVVSTTQLNSAMPNTFSNINARLNPLQPRPEINTTVGALVISKTEFASSLPPGCSSGPACNKPKDAGNQILILWLDRKDGGKMEEIRDKVFDEVTNSFGKVYVTTADGYKANLTVAQFIEPRFTVGFVLPMTATRGLELTWPGNPTIGLSSPPAISPPNAKASTSIKQATPAVVQVVVTATPRSSPTNQPASAVRPQVGYWEGPAVSFDVTSEGKIQNLRLTASDVQCTLKIDEVSIKPDGTFELIELIEEHNYWPGADREALKAKNVWPTPVVTEKGAMIQAQRINGKFTDPTTLTGSYKILVCGNQQMMLAPGREPTTWTAEWKGAARMSTPNVTVAPTKTAPPATSTSTRILPTPTHPPLKTELSEASAKGKVKFTIFGNGLESINVTLELTDDEPIEVTIAPGTVFQAMSGGVQNMVVRQPKTVALKSRGIKVTVEVQVACSSMHLDQPTSSDTFTIRKESTDPDLITLLTLPDFQMESFRVQQFAIWTITDNPSRNGYVGLGTGFSGYGSGPASEEFQRILSLFNKAGISTSKYQALRSVTLPPTPSLVQPTTAPLVTPTAKGTPAPGVHCDNPNAQITSPGMNQGIYGIVPFMGSANIPDFLYYKIQFMPESSYGTDKWGQLYQGKTPVPPTGKLMEWHTYTVEPGAYWLRLIVADRTGNYPDPCEIRVQVER